MYNRIDRGDLRVDFQNQEPRGPVTRREDPPTEYETGTELFVKSKVDRIAVVNNRHWIISAGGKNNSYPC